MRVKVGLETSSGSAAPSPLTIPLASVVLPAPRLPMSNTAARPGSSRASFSPSAMVSSSDAVRNVGTLLHGRGQVSQQVGCDQTFFTKLRRADLARKSMQIDRRGDGLFRIARELRYKSRDKSGEDVAGAAGRHRRGAAGI